MMRAPSKKPATPLAGPYGHPFHPLLVTIPIGAWVASLVFDIASRVVNGGSQMAVQAAYWLIGIGILGAGLAAIFGLMDLFSIPRGTKAFVTGITHMVLNLTVTGLFVWNFLWRAQDDVYKTATAVETNQLILSAVALGILTISGWLGGRMTYRFGVRVADESAQLEGYTKPRRVA